MWSKHIFIKNIEKVQFFFIIMRSCSPPPSPTVLTYLGGHYLNKATRPTSISLYNLKICPDYQNNIIISIQLTLYLNDSKLLNRFNNELNWTKLNHIFHLYCTVYLFSISVGYTKKKVQFISDNVIFFFCSFLYNVLTAALLAIP
jgi:hypothetical protein